MIQGRVWKKRSVGLTDNLRERAKCWLNPDDSHRQAMVSASLGKRKAGVKRRRN